MICENCNKDHDGLYGSGRFCSSICARGFSTKNKREEINQRVSEKLKGRQSASGGCPFKKGFDKRRKIFTIEDRKKAKNKKSENLQRKINFGKFEDFSEAIKRRIILEEQNNSCLWCGISDWNGKPISFELDHINGNNKDNSKLNLRILCPNCHSQTPTFRRKKNAPLKGIGIPS